MSTFFSKRRILVTGANGFVGKSLCIELERNQAIVYRLGHDKVDDIVDTKFINKLFLKERFDYCFHLAAQSLLEVETEDPTHSFDGNIIGTWNILEATRKYKLKGIIVASTTHVYGKNQLPFIEKYNPMPTGPYETSKVCADILAQLYANYYNLPVAIARFVNIYGPGDYHNRLIPKTIRLLLAQKQPQLYSKNVTRDYLFIQDAVNAYMSLMEKLNQLKKKDTNIIFNFGTGNHYSSKDIIEHIIRLMNLSEIKPQVLELSRRLEVNEQYVSIEKARTILHWQPKYSLIEGLIETIAWYHKNFNKKRI